MATAIEWGLIGALCTIVGGVAYGEFSSEPYAALKSVGVMAAFLTIPFTAHLLSKRKFAKEIERESCASSTDIPKDAGISFTEHSAETAAATCR